MSFDCIVLIFIQNFNLLSQISLAVQLLGFLSCFWKVVFILLFYIIIFYEVLYYCYTKVIFLAICRESSP